MATQRLADEGCKMTKRGGSVCSDRLHRLHMQQMLSYKRGERRLSHCDAMVDARIEADSQEVIVMALTEGYAALNRDAWRASRWTFEHATNCEARAIRRVRLMPAPRSLSRSVCTLQRPGGYPCHRCGADESLQTSPYRQLL